MHPPWVDPLAFGQGRISFSIPPVLVPSKVWTDFVCRAWELCTPLMVQVFTDGSCLGQKAGSTIVAMSRPHWLRSHRLTSPLCATATDAEQFSLGIAPGWAAHHLHEPLTNVTDIVFMSDSLTALNLYQRWPSASGANLLPLWKSGVQTLLDSFPQLHMHFTWSPGHEDIAGNEWADSEAKVATRLPPSNLPPSISTLKDHRPPHLDALEVTHTPGRPRSLPPSSWSILGTATSGTDVLTIEIRSHQTVRICNYYSMTPADREGTPPQYPGEHFLFNLPADLAASLMVCGDFNRRHHSWSNLHTNRAEILKAQPLDDFFRANGLNPAHDPDTDSRPCEGARRCPIDMVWAPSSIDTNSVLDTFESIQTPLSDHAHFTWAIPTTTPPPIPRTRRLTADDFTEWSKIAYPALDQVFQLPTDDTTSLDRKAAAVVKAMEDALAPFTSIAKPQKTEVAWWTPHCTQLLKAISSAPSALTRSSACQAFKRGVCAAKRTYYTEQAKEANPTNIWSWAKCGLGVRPTQVPSLRREDGTFTQSEEEKGELFRNTFFKEPPPMPDTGLPPAPPPPPPAPPLLTSKLEAALSGTSNLSAPGPSGISYRPLKWVIMHYPAEVLTLFNDCLRLGHHPECWRAAKVVMLRKPNKKDPFSPRSYQPITLEETLGKLLEKIVANRLQFLANKEDWLPPNQYGGRQGHSVYNASHHLLQIVECAHSKGQVCSILAVDIQGFFDSVHLALLHQQLVSMGCLLNMADWCLSFMMGRSVSISFDGTTLPSAPKPDLGTPQGSPVSPILLTIFAGLAIRRFQQPGCNLLAYVDDHLIMCVGPDIASNCDTLAQAYRQLNSHFLQLGLNIEAAKTEALHFHPPRRTIGYDNWRTTGIQITPTTIIKPTNPLRWLGIWWDPGLSFKAHIECMQSKGLSTLAALHILSNTERGISALLLRQLYSACIRTVLAWGVPVWYHGRSQKTLVNCLQAVQNTACRWILGVYKGASPLSTNFLCSTPPFFAYFEYLKTGHALRLWRTPHPVGCCRYQDSANLPFSHSLQVHVPHVQQVPAYTHPPWTDPLAFGQGRITFEVPPIPVPSEVRCTFVIRAREWCTPTSLQVFTDSSRIGTDSGSAICTMCGTRKLGYRRLASPTVATATDAEIFSLAGTLGWAATHLRDHLMEVKDIHFMSDSLVAINLFWTWPSASGAQLLPTWKAGMQTLLDSFPGLTVHFAWCPGHLDITGNEWADAEAKAATDLPPTSLAPSISALKEQSTLVAHARWSHQLACPLASTADKYLAVTEPPTRTPRKLLTLFVDHPRRELSAVAQVLCCASPYGGYWLSFNSAYRHVHGLIPYCRWHNHPPWPVQSTAHILGGCDAFQAWIPRVWPANRPPPGPPL
ncbi:hypothetical protein M0805_008263 [Coniferiporia weirii]|nr:hypothetical protein M0805_008263 [Coniferiporia weirii]